MTLTEQVARVLCEEDGHDPDGLSRARVVPQSPMWRAYEGRAGAAVRAMLDWMAEEAARVP